MLKVLSFMVRAGLWFRCTFFTNPASSQAVGEEMEKNAEPYNGSKANSSFENECSVGRIIGRSVAKDKVNLAMGVRAPTVSNFNAWKFIVMQLTGERLAFGCRAIFLLSFFSIIAPVNAIDNGENVVISVYPRPFNLAGHDAVPYALGNDVPRVVVGFLTGLIFIIGAYLGGAVKALLGPLMGITSVLWFIMRNDSAVKPGLSWLMFGLWSLLILAYLSAQCCRVAFHKLYVLLTLAFAGLCMCVVAVVQKSSIQGGLVTAIPPCTSFSAYAVAFFFPDRRSDIVSHLNIV